MATISVRTQTPLQVKWRYIVQNKKKKTTYFSLHTNIHAGTQGLFHKIRDVHSPLSWHSAVLDCCPCLNKPRKPTRSMISLWQERKGKEGYKPQKLYISLCTYPILQSYGHTWLLERLDNVTFIPGGYLLS